MLVTRKTAEAHSCAVNPSIPCRAAHCMAWRELADGRGWCGRTQMPNEAVGPFIQEGIAQLPLPLRAAIKSAGLL